MSATSTSGASGAQMFYIASLKHTNKHDEHIRWWGKDHRGYTPVIGDYVGEYSIDESRDLNDGLDCMAVPVEAVRALLSPEPYFRPGNPARFYDQRGPVVNNDRAVWNRLTAVSLGEGRHNKPKPEVYRGTRCSFSVASLEGVAP